MGKLGKSRYTRSSSRTARTAPKRSESYIEKWIGGKEGVTDRIAWWRLWRLALINNFFYKDSSESFPIRDYNLYSTGNAILSGKDRITVLFSLDGYPEQLPIGYVGEIRNSTRYDTRISFVSEFTPSNIDWNDPRMVSRMRSYAILDEAAESEDVTVYNYYKNIATLDRNHLRKHSIAYLTDADIRRDRQLFKYRRLMLVSGYRGPEFDEDLKLIKRYCSSIGLQMNRVDKNLRGILQTMSPMSKTPDPRGRAYREMGNNVIPDEIIARFQDYTQGKVGTSGIYIGNDIDSQTAVVKVFKKTDEDAENILVLAETGWGKSYFVKSQLIQLLANYRVIGTIMDIEGFEYMPIANFMANRSRVVKLNMGEGQGSYFDPVEIVTTGTDADLMGYGSEDAEEEGNAFSDTLNYTTTLFNTLIGDIGERPWKDVIVSDAVAGLYTDRGIVAHDPATWGYSRGLTIFDVYDRIVKEQEASHNLPPNDYRYGDQDYRSTITLIRGRLAPYFEKNGARRYVFSNRVSLDQIQTAKLVVCSFGMAGKTAEQVDPVQMGLIQMSAANISRIRSLYAKSQGLFNLKVWEELQRWVSFPGSKSILTTTVTGGRKLGDISFILSNNPTMFIGAGDEMGLFNNITSFMIGNIKDKSVRDEIANRLGVTELLPDLEMLSSSGDTESFNSETVDVTLESPYKRAFLSRLDDSVTTMVKVFLPDRITKSDLFRTGSSIKG